MEQTMSPALVRRPPALVECHLAAAGDSALVSADSAVALDGRQSVRAALIARGSGRLLVQLGFSLVSELKLASGRRADLVALSSNGEVWIVEIKSCVADFRADHKWPDYRLHCDRLLFAVDPAFPTDILPDDVGLIIADGHGAELIRAAPEHRLPGPTRKALTLRFARAAALRLHAAIDPLVGLSE
ncbi:transcription elongation factor [Blastochloris viridis]|uniref:Transcription elongation factor n=2 Tax=Blastochloris viridis TaxID=1079 RepID=A0A182D1Z6_BLAVI|nr:transcription elongation factor [Blastochloris viridis]